MNKIIRYSLGFLGMAGAVATFSTTSAARSVSAFIGQPPDPNNYTCFTNNFGAITDNCGGTRAFCAPLPVDGSAHDVQVTVAAPDPNHNIGCAVQVVNRDATAASPVNNYKFPSSFGSAQVIDLGNVSVPTFGGLFVCCNMTQTSTLDSINY